MRINERNKGFFVCEGLVPNAVISEQLEIIPAWGGWGGCCFDGDYGFLQAKPHCLYHTLITVYDSLFATAVLK